MRKPPAAGTSWVRPVGSAACTGASVLEIQSCTVAPPTTPAAPNPSIPRTTRRPIGLPGWSIPLFYALVRAYGRRLAVGSPNCKFWAEDPAGSLGDDGVGQFAKRARGFAARIGDGDPPADVPALPKGWNERDPSQQRNTQCLSQALASSLTEQVVATTVVAGEPTHVFDDASQGQVDLLRHVGAPLGDPLGGCLRRRHHIHLRAGQVLGHRQGDVTGTGRHIDNQK